MVLNAQPYKLIGMGWDWMGLDGIGWDWMRWRSLNVSRLRAPLCDANKESIDLTTFPIIKYIVKSISSNLSLIMTPKFRRRRAPTDKISEKLWWMLPRRTSRWDKWHFKIHIFKKYFHLNLPFFSAGVLMAWYLYLAKNKMFQQKKICWCWWCADAADAMMLLMRWCRWCADAAVFAAKIWSQSYEQINMAYFLEGKPFWI